jgi:putative transposase
VTAQPTAAWTRQQLPQALGFDTHYGYLLHDRGSIFSRELDAAVGSVRWQK